MSSALASVPSVVCGLVMAAAAASGASGPAAAAAALAGGVVLAGLRWRVAATFAVLLVVVAIGLGNPPTAAAAVAGLAAVGYLLLRHATGGVDTMVTVTAPTLISAAAFGIVGVIAAGFPLQLPWLPLAAAPAVLGVYLLALRPFLTGRS